MVPQGKEHPVLARVILRVGSAPRAIENSECSHRTDQRLTGYLAPLGNTQVASLHPEKPLASSRQTVFLNSVYFDDFSPPTPQAIHDPSLGEMSPVL